MERSSLKELLNDTILLKWVKKFSANNLLEDNKMATDKSKIATDSESISILDTTATKLLVTKSDFEGDEFVRFNLTQLNDLIECVGNKGELIIPANTEMREMIAKVGNDIIIVCPLPQKDKKSKK